MSNRSRFVAVFLAVALASGVYAAVSPAFATENRTPRNDVQISADNQFDAAHGVRSGAGTKRNPYVISGWQMGNLVIQNTDRYLTIRNNNIMGTMVLDWVGDRVDVHDNTINDLRVNQNVPRTGLPTSGTIDHNTFRAVGQLRHWDGLFANNVVGSNTSQSDTRGNQAVNFDGFNGAHFVNNTIYGYVDARLHGHHHSSGFGKPSHNHTHMATDPNTRAAKVLHRYRYHEVTIANNRIYSTASYALAYLDTNHAGNDRTAPSETDPNLENPHVHYTRVHIMENDLRGAGILVDTFNAQDDKHPWTETGLVHIEANRIALNPDNFINFRTLHGIEVRQARDLRLEIIGNSITGQKGGELLPLLEDMDSDAGIYLNTLDDANVTVSDNTVQSRRYGVSATQFTSTVHWRVHHLRTRNVAERVHYDQTVPNKPE